MTIHEGTELNNINEPGNKTKNKQTKANSPIFHQHQLMFRMICSKPLVTRRPNMIMLTKKSGYWTEKEQLYGMRLISKQQ